jgi:hypothetical protein
LKPSATADLAFCDVGFGSRLWKNVADAWARGLGRRWVPDAAGQAFKIPLTQRHIADATGLTSIHVNRVLRRLREGGVVEFQNGVLAVLDPDRLYALVDGHELRGPLREAAGPPTTSRPVQGALHAVG